MTNIIARCGCEEHDIDLCDQEFIVIGTEKWKPLCALRAMTKLVDEMRTKEVKLTKSLHDAERYLQKFTKLHNKTLSQLAEIPCANCSYNCGVNFKISNHTFYCEQCYEKKEKEFACWAPWRMVRDDRTSRLDS